MKEEKTKRNKGLMCYKKKKLIVCGKRWSWDIRTGTIKKKQSISRTRAMARDSEMDEMMEEQHQLGKKYTKIKVCNARNSIGKANNSNR